MSGKECNGRDTFCAICGCYIMQANRRSINDRTKECYEKCFNIPKRKLDNDWTPKIVCSSCQTDLYNYAKGRNNAKKFSAPMIWKKSKNHETDCYFCLCNTKGYNSKNFSNIKYPKVSSVRYPIPVSENEVSSNLMTDMPSDVEIQELADTFRESDEDDSDALDENASEEGKFNQQELNDLVRDLGLSKENAELLASRLQEKNCLIERTKVSFYRNRDLQFRKYFSKEKNLVYCNDVKNLISEFKCMNYNADDWRLFLDSSTRSFKVILLHNGNVYAPIPVAHSTVIKEEYESLDFVLRKLKYDEHKWLVCGDLKILTILLGQQSGFTKYPCFLCEWDSRARDQHYEVKEWKSRNNLEIGSKNIVKKSLLPVKRVLLPPLHIKLGLIKQLVKAMKTKDSIAFQYLFEKFPKLSEAKINEGVFDGPQIRDLFKDEHFEELMTDTEKDAWQSFREVSTSFLGNKKTPEYKTVVKKMVTAFKNMNCLMNLKLHFLDSHIEYFPENLGDFSEEQGERMHQDLKDVEKRWQGIWDEHMLADYCWGLMRETKIRHKRKAIRRSFENKRTRYSAKR